MELPEHLIQQTRLSQENVNVAIAQFERHDWPKGHALFNEGEICDRIFYIEKGFGRFSNISEAGKEITTWFFPDQSFLTAIESFYNGKPAETTCVLNEDSVIYSITYSQYNQLLNDYPELGKFCFTVVFELARQMVEYISSSKFLTAEDRYNELIKRHPLILQKASLGQIASFLGITQETLSRIRAKK
ncbi:MAG TPA: Crp/Fnr family transcriptional regulator [Bacteroidales bacterium]|nr:Crp/Fnr family transcriptional regulator [Bacteroidales bacterium]